MVLLADYFKKIPDPDRGIALAALTGNLKLPNVTPTTIRRLISSKVDPILFSWSYDFVGDLAETTALMWPSVSRDLEWPRLGDIYSKIILSRKT